MAISSTGIGSGLDVTSIISQLVALEKVPLTKLETQATTIQSKLTTMGTIKSQVSSLSDAAFKLTLDSSWNTSTVTSSNSTAVTGTATGTTAVSSISVAVSQLAKAQTVSSAAIGSTESVGTGTLTIDLGTWDYGTVMTPLVPPVFGTPSKTVSVNILAGEDSLASIAAAINNAGAGVVADIVTDTTGQRLAIRSSTTGEASGFRVKVTGDSDADDVNNTGLSRLAFDPGTVPAYGMAGNAYSKAQNALATVNSIAISSASNTVTGAVSGLTLQLSTVTTTDVTIQVATDQAAIKKNIDEFVTAYNALNTTLSDATKYDAETKTAGIFQGDTVAVGLKNALISLLGSTSTGSTLSRLSDAGLELQAGGALKVNNSKLTTAFSDLDNLKKLFKTDNQSPLTNGFALKMKDFARGLLATDGMVTTKTNSLDVAVSRNTKEQDKVNDRIVSVTARLKKTYSLLDAQMANLTALNTYITQQVAQWNKNTN